MYSVLKRNGKTEEFDISKIKKDLRKAFKSCKKKFHPDIIDLLTLKVSADFEPKIKEDTISVEEIKDSVESVLISTGYEEVAKSYIINRKQKENARNASETLLDYKKTVDDYLKVNDWRVKENSTVTYSVGGLILSNSGAMTANYWLSEVYDKEIAKAHKNADIHIHDLSMLTPYCGGWSLKQLIKEGLGGVPGKITSSPASHLSTLCNQMVNFLGILQNEWAGAQAFSSFDTYLAPFVKADNLSYKEVKQCIQSFIYGVNTPSRWGCVTEDTEVLTVDGFKKYNELKKGDFIYTWKDGLLEVNPVNEIVIKPYKGKIHKYIGEGYVQAVSPEHRVLTVSKEHPEGQIVISEYLNDISNLFVPVNFELSTAYTLAFTRDLKDCNIIIDNDEVLIDVSNFDKKKIDKLQHLILAKGRTSYISDNYIKFSIKSSKKINKKEEVDYEGIVWCPNVENGTAVFRKDGCVYISGQCQAPFTNITLDWTVPDDLAELNCIVGGKEMDFKYKDCKKEMDMVNKAFIEVMLEGDANGRGFQYPIPTYSITKNFDWSETENNRLLFEMTAKYGTPYFSNYVNSDMEPSDIRSMCCRLRLDLRELRKKSGGFFGSGESTGSIGVVTLNLPKLAYLSENESVFYSKLNELMDLAARSLHIKRTVVSNLLEAGLYPYTKRYLGSFNNHFSTIGLVGMNEVGLNAKWLKADMTNKKTQQFAKDVLNHMRERLSDYQELYEGELFNLEATPAESTVYRFAKHDRAKYPDIITAGEPGATPYYTNSSHLPVGYTDDIFSALDIQDELQTLYTSGTVFHGFLGEKLPSWQSAMVLVRKIAENYKLPYYTLSPTYSVCKNHGYIAGEVYECPDCKEKTEVYSRITGYYRPVQNWNDGKSQEFKDRKIYKNPIKEETTTAFDSALAGSKIFLKEQGFISDAGEPKLSSCTVAPIGIKHILIATKTCPNCKIAASLLDKAGIKHEKVLAEENPEIPTKLGIKQAPTLVVYYNDEPTLYSGVSNIKKYINS